MRLLTPVPHQKVKEALCFVSADADQERLSSTDRGATVDWRGGGKQPAASTLLPPLVVGEERFLGPELLFAPARSQATSHAMPIPEVCNALSSNLLVSLCVR